MNDRSKDRPLQVTVARSAPLSIFFGGACSLSNKLLISWGYPDAARPRLFSVPDDSGAPGQAESTAYFRYRGRRRTLICELRSSFLPQSFCRTRRRPLAEPPGTEESPGRFSLPEHPRSQKSWI